jgi:hypothetical protein
MTTRITEHRQIELETCSHGVTKTSITKYKKEIGYYSSFFSSDEILELKHFYNVTVNDWWSEDAAYPEPRLERGLHGCWSRPLRLEREDNPLHKMLNRLKEQFGDFRIHEGSLERMAYPFMPHSEVRTSEWRKEQRKRGYRPGYVFLIPLWWKDDYKAGTAFFSNPPDEEDDFYEDHHDILPRMSSENYHNALEKNLGVTSILMWEKPGDLICWSNYLWHASTDPDGYEYSNEFDNACKEFITIETEVKTIEWKI